MNLIDLKLTAASEITESETYTNESKLELLEYVEESTSPEELIAFIEEGVFSVELGEIIFEAYRTPTVKDPKVANPTVNKQAAQKMVDAKKQSSINKLRSKRPLVSKEEQDKMKLSDDVRKRVAVIKDNKAKAAAFEKMKADSKAVTQTAQKAGSKVGGAVGSTLNKIGVDGEKAANIGKSAGKAAQVVTQKAGELNQQANAKSNVAAKKINNMTGSNVTGGQVKTAAGIGLAAAGLIAAFKIYKAMKSKGASDAQAKAAQIKALTSAKSKCKGDQGCMKKIDAKIAKLR